jgi:hypothetical protein
MPPATQLLKIFPTCYGTPDGMRHLKEHKPPSLSRKILKATSMKQAPVLLVAWNIFYPESGGNTFLRKAGRLLPT